MARGRQRSAPAVAMKRAKMSSGDHRAAQRPDPPMVGPRFDSRNARCHTNLLPGVMSRRGFRVVRTSHPWPRVPGEGQAERSCGGGRPHQDRSVFDFHGAATCQAGQLVTVGGAAEQRPKLLAHGTSCPSSPRKYLSVNGDPGRDGAGRGTDGGRSADITVIVPPAHTIRLCKAERSALRMGTAGDVRDGGGIELVGAGE